MKVKPILICLFVLHLYIEPTYSQNYFSQFFSAPLNINPSNTGNFTGDFRFGGIYRNEPEKVLSSSYYSLFGDISVLSSHLSENDRLAIGLLALGEKNSFNGIKNNSVLLSTSYRKSLNEDGTESLTAAFQIDFAHKKIDPPHLVFRRSDVSLVQ